MFVFFLAHELTFIELLGSVYVRVSLFYVCVHDTSCLGQRTCESVCSMSVSTIRHAVSHFFFNPNLQERSQYTGRG